MNGNFYEDNNYLRDDLEIVNILKNNHGKKAKFYITIPGSNTYQDKVIEGIIEYTGKDNVIVSNPENGEWYLVILMFLDFVTFEEKINYSN